MYLLSHQIVQEQAFSKVLIETTLPNIADRRKELYLPIHKDSKVREYITGKIKHLIEKKRESQDELESIKSEF